MAPLGAAAGAAPDLARADGGPVQRPGEARCQGPRPGEAARCPTSTAPCACRRWCTSGDHYGSKDTETIVRAPVVAEASMPRVLAPGDRSSVTLDVQNFTGKAGEFKVRVEGIGPLSICARRAHGEAARRRQDHLTFPLPAREGYTTAQVRVRVEATASRSTATTTCRCARPGRRCMRARTRVLDALDADRLGADLADGLMADSVQRAHGGQRVAADSVRQRAGGRAEVSLWLRRADHQQGLRRAGARRGDREDARRAPGWAPSSAARAWRAPSAAWPRCRSAPGTSRCGATAITSTRR